MRASIDPNAVLAKFGGQLQKYAASVQGQLQKYAASVQNRSVFAFHAFQAMRPHPERNSEGSVVEANYGRVKVSSALATEGGTIRVACTVVAKREAKDIIIETDCQPVVKMLNSGLCSDWEIQVLLEDTCG
ncbi:hypothetical protein RHMOL_Rhmol04G0050000 [Rhododendron molle]|uniref:Uncharacterized protein n=1 Tax=Rhododendron molle TaxID=49168 RepID=A0ACC0NYB0_RHOML|nr:hypothetical protein RHMOL_Rhmol04G0050000 [Rhododendron molle]